MASDCFGQSALATMINSYLSGLGSLVIGLNTSQQSPTPQNLLFANIVEPTGTWYSRFTCTFQNAYALPDGSLEVNVDSVQWNYSGSSAGETIYGYWVGVGSSSGGVTLVSQGVLATPVQMAANLNAVTAGPVLHFPLVRLGS